MSKPYGTYLYYRRCKLNKIKECSVFFYTNRKNRLFCCDGHRYQWHNNIRSLFKRVARLEESMRIAFVLFEHLGIKRAKDD